MARLRVIRTGRELAPRAVPRWRVRGGKCLWLCAHPLQRAPHRSFALLRSAARRRAGIVPFLAQELAQLNAPLAGGALRLCTCIPTTALLRM